MVARNNTRRPPGSYGLPLTGVLFDTADFLFCSGWERFFDRRREKYQSSVFRVSLFQKTIVVMDHQAISTLFASEPFVQDYGFSWAVPPRPLVGEVVPSIFETGDSHDRPKGFYLNLLRSRSAELPKVFEDVFSAYAEKWAKCRTFSWRDEIERFTVDFVFRWITDVKCDVEKTRTIYNNIFTDIFWPITRFFPGSTYSRSLRAYKELLDNIISAERFEEIFLLAQQHGLTDRDYVVRQLAFLVGMNSYLGLQCLFKSILGELSAHSDIRNDLVDRLANFDVAQAWSIPHREVDFFTMEVLRLHPPVFFIFGRAESNAKIDSSSGTFSINKGELLMGVIPAAHTNSQIFCRPNTFEPERFSNSDAEKYLIWPRGLHEVAVGQGDRTCPGKDAALRIARVFCATILTRTRWTLGGKIEWDRRRFNLNVAAPVGPLLVKNFELI